MSIDVEKTIREYIGDIVHLSLATSVGDMPWVCEVHFVYDDKLNLYFRSTAVRRHSKEILINPNVAGNIIRQHRLGEAPRGVYFEGTAKQLENVGESDPAYTEYCKRFGTTSAILEDAKTPTGHKFYKISVKKFYLFDGIESTPAQKYELVWNR